MLRNEPWQERDESELTGTPLCPRLHSAHLTPVHHSRLSLCRPERRGTPKPTLPSRSHVVEVWRSRLPHASQVRSLPAKPSSAPGGRHTGVSQAPQLTGSSLGSPPGQSYAAAPCRPGDTPIPAKQDVRCQAGSSWNPSDPGVGRTLPTSRSPSPSSSAAHGATHACPPPHTVSQARPLSAFCSHECPFTTLLGDKSQREGECANKDHHHHTGACNRPEHTARSRHSGHGRSLILLLSGPRTGH